MRKQRETRLEKLEREQGEVIGIVASDWLALAKRRSTNDVRPPASSFTQLERRSLVRASFALVEAYTHMLKSIVNNPADCTKRPNIGERMFLSENTYTIKKNGIVRATDARIPLLSNIQFTFRTFCRLRGIDKHLATSESGWRKLTDAVKVRDRLMHPKKNSDLEVSDLELNEVIDAVEWLDKQMKSVLVRALHMSIVPSKLRRSHGHKARD